MHLGSELVTFEPMFFTGQKQDQKIFDIHIELGS